MAFDFKETLEQMFIEDKKRISTFEQAKKKGTPEMPEELRLYNKHNKKYNIENISSIQFHTNYVYYGGQVASAIETINNTILFCKEVFDIELDKYEAANISTDMFDWYYYRESEEIEKRIALYHKGKNVLLLAHDINEKDLEKTETVLKQLGLEVPLEVKLAKKIKEKYAKNQKKKALTRLLFQLFPEINTKYIIDKITAKALSSDTSQN